MKIFFRCDASKKIGGGHVSRCITLAKELQRRGGDCTFICNDEAADIFPALKEFTVLPSDTLPQTCDAIVVDHYALDVNYESSWRGYAKEIIVIDDLANRKHDCDILLDQTFKQLKGAYKDLVPEGCQLLLGSEYALLKPEFSELREASLNRRNGKIQTILISFGSVDIHKLCPLTLKALEKVQKPLNIDMICEAGHLEMDCMKRLVSASRHQVHFHHHVNNMAEFMMKADLAIGAVGTTSWERASLGLPTIAIQVAENQKTIIENLQFQGAVYNLGLAENVNQQAIVNQINTLLENSEKLMICSEKSAQVTDGKGAAKVAKIILKEISNG